MAHLVVNTLDGANIDFTPFSMFVGLPSSGVTFSSPTRLVIIREDVGALVIEGTDLGWDNEAEVPWTDGTVTSIKWMDVGLTNTYASIEEITVPLPEFGGLLFSGDAVALVEVFLSGNDLIEGNSGRDILFGSLGNDTVLGGDGDDTIHGSLGADSLDGGTGSNTLSYATLPNDPIGGTGVTVDLGSGLAIDQWGYADTILNFDNVSGSIGADLITGNSADNFIMGNLGDDTLEGAAGNDVLWGGEGNDSIDGGEGTDTLRLSGLDASRYTFRRNDDGTVTVTDLLGEGGDGVDVIRGIEKVSFAGVTERSLQVLLAEPKTVPNQLGWEDTPWSYTLPANLFDASSHGFAVTLADGSSLPSWINFNSTTRTFSGTPPKDWSGSVSLKVTAVEFDEPVSLDFSITVQAVNDAPHALSVVLGGSVAENSKKGTFVATVQGYDIDSSSFSYSLANDADGRFYMSGNSILVADGVKLDFEQARAHVVTVKVSDSSGASYLKDVTIGITDVAKETATGSTGADRIVGGSGADRISGGLGNDILTGGKGKDTFVFDTKLDKKKNVDTITDFNVKDDTIQIDNKYFTKVGSKGTPTKPVKLDSKMFWTGTKAHDEDDRIIYDKKSGALYYDADGTGKAAAVKFAQLKKGLALTDKDFYVI